MLDNEGGVFLQNTGNHSLSDIMAHPRTPDFLFHLLTVAFAKTMKGGHSLGTFDL
jgi:hypothetical protein